MDDPEQLEVSKEMKQARERQLRLRIDYLRRKRSQLALQHGNVSERVKTIDVQIDGAESSLKAGVTGGRKSPARIRGNMKMKIKMEKRASEFAAAADASGRAEGVRAVGSGLKPTAAMQSPHHLLLPGYWRSFHAEEARPQSTTSTADTNLPSQITSEVPMVLLSHAQPAPCWVRPESEPPTEAGDRIVNPDSLTTTLHSEFSEEQPAEGVRSQTSEWEERDSSAASLSDVASLQGSTSAAYDGPNDNDSSQANTVPPSSDDGSASDPADPDLAELDPPMMYNISPADRRNAAMASRNSNAAYWSYKLYKDSKGNHPTLHYCTNVKRAEEELQDLLEDKVLGFDLEWEANAKATAGTKKNVSLIQVAGESKIVLLQVAMFTGDTAEELVPKSLRTLLESDAIIKAGVNINGDCRRMHAYLGVEVKGQFELSHLYRVIKHAEGVPRMRNRMLRSMADQVQDILLLPLKKGDERTSAWSKRLNAQQCEYAGSDAYAGFRLYHELEAKRKALRPPPRRPAFYELRAPLIFADGQVAPAPSLSTKSRSTTAAAAAGKASEVDEEADEEFYDAVETLDASELDTESEVAGVPSSEPEVSYPSLPPLEEAAVSTDDNTTTAEESPPQAFAQPPSETPTKQTRPSPPASHEVDLAESWISTWRAALPTATSSTKKQPDIGTATLRAYHLWHEQGLSIKHVAALARDPPLQVQTVASYILQAVKEGDLPFEAARMREVLETVPRSVHGRYQRIMERLG